MKYAKLILLAALCIGFGAILLEIYPVLFFLFMFATDPTLSGCDEAIELNASNGRGDVVEEYWRACTGFGTESSAAFPVVRW